MQFADQEFMCNTRTPCFRRPSGAPLYLIKTASWDVKLAVIIICDYTAVAQTLTHSLIQTLTLSVCLSGSHKHTQSQ